MHSPSLRTTIFVVIVLALLFSLGVSGDDIEKREPQNQSPTSPPNTVSASQAPSSDTNTGKASGTSAPSQTVSGSAPASANNTSPASDNPTSSPTPPDPLTPAVLVQITDPISAKNILFKIGSNVTFAWKYSSNFSDGYAPKFINVYAQSSLDSTNYYTIVANATGNTTKVIWITATEEPSLPMTTYRLYICDERGLTAGALPGALSVFSGLIFSMYTPRGRTDLPDFSCATCEGANLNMPYIPLLATFSISLITIIYLSFGLS